MGIELLKQSSNKGQAERNIRMATKKTPEQQYQEKMDKLDEKLAKLAPRIESAQKKVEDQQAKFDTAKEKLKDAKTALTDLVNDKLELQNEMLILYMQTHHNNSDVAYYDSFLETIKSQFESGNPAKNFIKDDE